MKHRRVLLLCLIGLVGGCAEQWVKPGAGQAEFNYAEAACKSAAFQRFPVELQRIKTSDGYYREGEKHCWTENGQKKCRRGEQEWVPPSHSNVDLNEEGRNQNRIACLYKKGWTMKE
jgi:hypothetical protein